MFVFIMNDGTGPLKVKIINAEGLDGAIRTFIISDNFEQCIVGRIVIDVNYDVNGHTFAEIEDLEDKYCSTVNDEESYMGFINDNIEKLTKLIKVCQDSIPSCTFAIIETDPINSGSDVKSATKQ